jgi:hypothetical protein
LKGAYRHNGALIGLQFLVNHTANNNPFFPVLQAIILVVLQEKTAYIYIKNLLWTKKIYKTSLILLKQKFREISLGMKR